MANPGDMVQVEAKTQKEIGILMPSSLKNIVLLKLSTGYNIGFEKKDVKKITVLKKGSTKKKSKEKKPSQNKKLPTIAILHTGGTIASKVDYRTGGVVASFKPEDLISMFPEIAQIANIKSELVSQMWSDDLRFSHITLIAQKIKKYVTEKKVDGIIIGMGTDNVAASAALSFMIENSPIPIIFVGSQRSSDRGSSDAAMNLICAAEFIVNSDFGGVGICMHASVEDTYCYILPATKTFKLHSSRRDAFKPINSSAIAKVEYRSRKITFVGKDYQKKSSQFLIKPKMEEKVGLLKIHINMVPEQFLFYEGYRGLIIEGTGLGHTPGQVPNDLCKVHKKMYPSIKKLIKAGCVVVMTTQCIFGAVNMNVYDKGKDLQKLGVIPGKDMLSTTAFVKLSWLLAHFPPSKVKELIRTNLRGEINEHIEYEKEFI
jgi:glutamyl-tRNA(Gln) amidotransferase subunit D